MRRLNIRWRLTLWFGAAMTVLLVVRSVWIYFMLEQWLTANADYELNLELETLEAEIRSASGRQELQNALQRHAASRRDLSIDVLTSDQETLFHSPFVTPIRAAASCRGILPTNTADLTEL